MQDGLLVAHRLDVIALNANGVSAFRELPQRGWRNKDPMETPQPSALFLANRGASIAFCRFMPKST
jgi:hypothetical protein